jgi:hypothetical protein
MAQYTSKIVNSWSLTAFALLKGPKMKVGDFTNAKTNEPFKACVFINKNDAKTFVSFSSNLGELTPRQIAAQQDSLQVVELESGNFSLCKQGEDTWEDVDLNL